MQRKKLSAFVFAVLCLCMVFSTSVSAATIDMPHYPISAGISPTYEVADRCISNLDFAGKTAYCESRANGNGVVSITVEQTLQKYSGWFWIWNDVDGARWTKSTNSSIINLSSSKSGLSSGKYRVKSVFKLTNTNGKTETITVYSVEKKLS